MHELILKSDSLLTEQAIKVGEDLYAMQGNLTSEITRLMQRFSQCHIQHVSRMGNEVAHELNRHDWQSK